MITTLLNCPQLRAKACLVRARLFFFKFLVLCYNCRLLLKRRHPSSFMLKVRVFFLFFVASSTHVGNINSLTRCKPACLTTFFFSFSNKFSVWLTCSTSTVCNCPVTKSDTEEERILNCAAQGCTRLRCDIRFCSWSFVCLWGEAALRLKCCCTWNVVTLA